MFLELKEGKVSVNAIHIGFWGRKPVVIIFINLTKIISFLQVIGYIWALYNTKNYF